MPKWKVAFISVLLLIILAAFAYYTPVYFIRITKTPPGELEYIGRDKCKVCHQQEFQAWSGSHHDKAMDVASDSTVLGNFDNSTFTFNGLTSTFYKKAGAFFVRTNGPGGKMADFEITHTFGFRPLQQYLIPFEKGRYQCLPIAWDSEKNTWFSLVGAVYGDNIPKPSDWLYWTNNGQNWNGMCAECHSTNLQKNFDPVTKEYTTTFSEIDVSCEACHGAGSGHEQWANLPDIFRSADSSYGLLARTSHITNRDYVNLCAYCHSRRTALGAMDLSGKHLMDNIIPTILDENYFPDGQILEEDYVFGSFTQSKMYAKGIKCNDCHNVHSGKMLAEGNQLCNRCHLAEKYDAVSHHFHEKKIEKAHPEKSAVTILCIDCHMPGRYYMGNDFRRDHSLRIPRPDLTITTAVPNACNQCHKNQSAAWADAHISRWYGSQRKAHFAKTFALGRVADDSTLADIIMLGRDKEQLPVVRATALSLLANYSGPQSTDAVIQGLKDDDALVRYNALHAFNTNDPQVLLIKLLPLLQDPTKSIRMEAGLKLSVLPPDMIPDGQKLPLEKALTEYTQAMNYSADFASSRHNLGIVNSNLRRYDLAAEQYYEAIAIDSLFYPAKVNLAVVLNQLGRNDEAEIILRDLIASRPDFYDSYYSLGLLLAEKQDYREALKFLHTAGRLMPERPRIQYNLGLILQFLNQQDAAEKALRRAIDLEPGSLDYLYALADHYIKRKQFRQARKIAEEIKTRFPASNVGDQILRYIENSTSTL